MKWLTAALQRNEQASAALRAKALNGIALIASFQGNYSQIKTVCKESVAIAQEANDKHEIALALELLGDASAKEGNLEDGILLLQQTRQLAEKEGDRWILAILCIDLGYALMRKGDYSSAETIFNDGLKAGPEMGMKFHGAYCLTFLAALKMRSGSFQQARNNLEEGVRIFVDARDTFGLTMSLVYFAELARAESKPEVAVKLFATAAAICRTADFTLFPIERAVLDRSVAELQTQLPKAAFNAAWTEGGSMTLEQGMAYAIT